MAASGAVRASIGAALDDLIAYVADHFAHEEREMEAKEFGGFAAHKAEHDALVNTCVELQTNFKAGSADVTEDTGALVKTWFESHIPTFDFAYSDTLNSFLSKTNFIFRSVREISQAFFMTFKKTVKLLWYRKLS